MPTKEILNSYSVVELRKEVSKTNIKGYSKMKKSEVVELMMKPNNKPKFHHIKAKTKATKAKAPPPAPAPAPKKTYKFKKKEKAKPSSVGVAAVPEKKKTAGEKLTGLTKEEMNKLSPSELFGKLPVALAKKVLDPKTTGVKVGAIPISKITEENLKIYDLVDENEDSNYNDSMLYNDDYTDVMSRSQSDWYLKANRKGYDNLSEKSQKKFEKLEMKILEGISNILSKRHSKIFRKWKKANKGMVSSFKKFQKSFESYYESH